MIHIHYKITVGIKTRIANQAFILNVELGIELY